MPLDIGLIVLSAGALVAAGLGAPWHDLRRPAFQHLLLGATVATIFLWRMRAPLTPDLSIHLLCATTVTLMFGVRVAVIVGALAATALCVLGVDAWSALPRDFIALGVVPVGVSWAIFRGSQRYLPPNPFVYIFVAAFFGAAAAMLASVLTHDALLLASWRTSLAEVGSAYPEVLPLLAFPEAFVNGALVSGLVVFLPGWIPTFDDRIYLRG